MRNNSAPTQQNIFDSLPGVLSRKTTLGVIMFVALLAFELFNFDTTRYALTNLLGDVRFVGLSWAGILAIAFCAIDFAGLARLFTPQRGAEEPTAVWYLTGAWLLGATMNAVMTWWAVSLTLLTHDFGNEVLSRAQLLQIVPIFVAALVWLTRILFIGAISVAGEHLFDAAGAADRPAVQPTAAQPAAGQRNVPTSAPPRRERPLRSPGAPGPIARRTPAPMQARKRR